MSLLDRLNGTEEPRIACHQFYSALVGLADGQVTRGQIESLFGIADTGTDATELTAIISGYQGAADKGRYLTALHAVFMLLENEGYTLTKAQVNTWLTAAQSAYS